MAKRQVSFDPASSGGGVGAAPAPAAPPSTSPQVTAAASYSAQYVPPPPTDGPDLRRQPSAGKALFYSALLAADDDDGDGDFADALRDLDDDDAAYASTGVSPAPSPSTLEAVPPAPVQQPGLSRGWSVSMARAASSFVHVADDTAGADADDRDATGAGTNSSRGASGGGGGGGGGGGSGGARHAGASRFRVRRSAPTPAQRVAAPLGRDEVVLDPVPTRMHGKLKLSAAQANVAPHAADVAHTPRRRRTITSDDDEFVAAAAASGGGDGSGSSGGRRRVLPPGAALPLAPPPPPPAPNAVPVLGRHESAPGKWVWEDGTEGVAFDVPRSPVVPPTPLPPTSPGAAAGAGASRAFTPPDDVGGSGGVESARAAAQPAAPSPAFQLLQTPVMSPPAATAAPLHSAAPGGARGSPSAAQYTLPPPAPQPASQPQLVRRLTSRLSRMDMAPDGDPVPEVAVTLHMGCRLGSSQGHRHLRRTLSFSVPAVVFSGDPVPPALDRALMARLLSDARTAFNVPLLPVTLVCFPPELRAAPQRLESWVRDTSTTASTCTGTYA